MGSEDSALRGATHVIGTLLAGTLLGLAPTASRAQSSSQGDTIPELCFESFLSFPALNDAGTPAFVAKLANEEDENGMIVIGATGVFTGPDLADRVADSDGSFNAFTNYSPSINNLGQVVFRATLDSGVVGIYTGPDPSVDLIADSTGSFNRFGDAAINDQGTVAFRAVLDNGDVGIFTGPDPVTNRLVGSGDALFGGTVDDVFFAGNGALNEADDIVFVYVLDSGVTGVAVAQASGFTKVADSSSLVLEDFQDAKLDDSREVVFFAREVASSNTGLFRGPDPASDTVADTGGPYTAFFDYAIGDDGTVVFLADAGALGFGYYTGPDPAVDVFVDNSGAYDGFGSLPAINSGGTIAFLGFTGITEAGLFTGPDPAADALVDNGVPCPEAGAAGLAAAVAVALWVLCRTRPTLASP
jgi:hypothetical protein